MRKNPAMGKALMRKNPVMSKEGSEARRDFLKIENTCGIVAVYVILNKVTLD